MLYLGEGLRQVTVGDDKKLYLFPDFSDETKFYYLPHDPRIARMEDGSPAIRLLVYREDLDAIPDDSNEAAAFLSLDVDLSWPPELIDQAASALRVEDTLDEKPRLTPIFFREGSVKLMLLDAVTGDEDAGPSEPDESTQFVSRITGSGSPSLYGENRAIFQAVLSKKGAAALSGALEGVTPIGVVYTLTFAGLQPAYNIRAKIDWQKVYDHFSTTKKTDVLFYQHEVQKSVDKLVEDRVIELEMTIEGIGADAMDASREEVLKSVRTLIFDKFFEATLDREDAAGQAVEDRVVGFLRGAATLGLGYSYTRKEVKVEELRTLNLDWTARRATERTIYPQAHMHNLLTESGTTRDQLITIIDGGDELWKTLPFEVTTTANWDDDGIVGISLDIEYEDADSGAVRSWSTFLDKNKPRDTKREWMDRASGNAFRYKYEVVFQDTGVPGPHPKVNSGEEWLTHEGTILVVHPRELYESVELEVGTVPGFPFDRWPAVQAFLRYRTEDGSFVHHEDGVLKSDSLSFSTRFRIDRDRPGVREMRFYYIGSSDERFETEWMPMESDTIVVEDPHAEDLTVRALVAGNRSNIANLLVDLEYTDPDNGIHETGNLQFDQQNISQPQEWTVHLADPERRRYRYRMTLVTVDTGDFLQTGWISTDAPTLPVGEVYVRRLTVEVVTGELGSNVESINVKLEYHDHDNAIHEVQEFHLGAKARSEWLIELKDASKRSYQVTTTWIRTDGFDKTVGPETSSKTYLVIEGSPPEDG